MERVETRELSYFLAVASELHFGRAAEKLGIAQPPLSRAIRQLERRMGVDLLQRGPRGVRLTPAGEVLSVEADKALAAVRTAVYRTQRAGASTPGLVVAMKAGGDGGMLPRILDEYRRLPGALPVDVVVCGAAERAVMLRDGTVDLALLHSNYEDVSGFDTEPLCTEGAVVVLPNRHRLAGNAEVQLSDLEGETFPHWRGMPETGDTETREVRDVSEMMQHIALGRMVAVAPESVRDQLRRDLVGVPVSDAPVTTIVLAWPKDSRNAAVATFVRTATSMSNSKHALRRA